LTTSLGSVTNTLKYNWNCTYVNEFPVAFEDLDVDKLRTIAELRLALMGYGVASTGLAITLGRSGRLRVFPDFASVFPRQLLVFYVYQPQARFVVEGYHCGVNRNAGNIVRETWRGSIYGTTFSSRAIVLVCCSFRAECSLRSSDSSHPLSRVSERAPLA
jgi:hypothetical protein